MVDRGVNDSSRSQEREIVFSRSYDVPRELLWRAWTDSGQIGAWWGPRGYTTATSSMEVKTGGFWIFRMNGPDGSIYANRVSYLDVVRPSRLVYDHGSDDGSPAHFRATVTFEDLGEKTEMEFRMLFPSVEACAQTRVFMARTGGNSTWDRLEEFLMPR
jgi:uncharacterized protein YndB with AHSA1/START domain